MMKEITQFEKHTVEIWRRPRQRHMHLRVRPGGELRVTCNKRVAKRDIFTFIRESEEFIKKCLLKLSEQQVRYPPKQLISGEPFLYFGTHRPLQIVWSWSARIRVTILAEQIEMVAPVSSTAEQRRMALHRFLQKQAREVLSARVHLFAQQMQLFPTDLVIRGQKTRWGSCSSKGKINLNWKLMAAPPEVIDYVVIHELAHLRHMNHSARFWNLVAEFFPEHRRAKQWLKANETEIAVQFQKISKAAQS